MDAMEPQVGSSWPVNRRLDPCVVRLGWSSLSRSGKSVRIQHPYWVLDYSLDALIRTRVGSVRAPWRERGAQVAHLYPPQTQYWEWSVTPGAMIRAGHVVFQMKDETLLRDFFLKGAEVARIMDSEGLIGHQLKEGARAVGRNPGGPSFWLAQSTLCAVLGLILGARPAGSGHWVVGGTVDQKPSGLVAQVETYLKSRLVEPVVLADIARALHLSRSSLSHRYKELTGTSPMQTLLRLRVDQAKSLLVRGYKLDDIAGQCGFYDAAHFSRVFQAKTGQTPRRFARTL